MKLGYLNIIKEDESFVGGIMIADERGIPVEFKYTDPIIPTKLQKVLYGDVLEKYLREEIIITNLVSKVENTPEIYIIDDPKNFYLKSIIKEPVVMIKTTQLKPMREETNFKFIKENEAIVQIDEESPPLRVILPEELLQQKEEMVNKVVEAAGGMTVTEPLSRIEEALKLICRKEL